jgi:hypothetical protein
MCDLTVLYKLQTFFYIFGDEWAVLTTKMKELRRKRW